MTKSGVFTICAAALCGCATLSPQAKAIKQVQPNEIASACAFVFRVDAGDIPRSAAASYEVTSAKQQALEEAAARGGTHVVWNERAVESPPRKLVTGEVYRCPPGAVAAGAGVESVKPEQPAPEASAPAPLAVPASTTK